MLKKFKITSYAFIYFFMIGFSFIALQATTEEVEAAPGVCEPVERIRNMKDTARHSDYEVWEERCQVSGSNGQCGNRTEWPAGDGGRCEMTTADSHDMQAEASAELMEKYEKALIEINNLNETISDLRTDQSSLQSQHQQVQKDTELNEMCENEKSEIKKLSERIHEYEYANGCIHWKKFKSHACDVDGRSHKQLLKCLPLGS